MRNKIRINPKEITLKRNSSSGKDFKEYIREVLYEICVLQRKSTSIEKQINRRCRDFPN
jgi:hypothetical protein